MRQSDAMGGTDRREAQAGHAMGMDDAYRVERVLARGAAGVTELVTLVADGSGPFVRKRIPSGEADRLVWAALAGCRSPRLPKVLATYELADAFVVVCDYVPGPTLAELVAERGRPPRETAVRLVGELCEAATELHVHGIAHRDIAPSNVVVASDGAHLVDLGIARMVGAAAAGGTASGRPGSERPLGTWGFAAPEQHGIDGRATADERSDVYSLGRVLGHLLTGVDPSDAAYGEALADDRLVPPAMREVVRHACAFEPSARYQSARELGEAVATAARGGAVPAPGSAAAGMAGRGASAAKAVGPEVASKGRGPRRTSRHASPGATRPTPVTLDDIVYDGPSMFRFMLGALVIFALFIGVVFVTFYGVGYLGERFSKDDAPSAAQPTSGKADAEAADGGAAGRDQGAGSSSAVSIGSSADDDARDMVEIAEYGWCRDETDGVRFVVGMRNVTDDKLVSNASATVTWRGEDGSVLGVDTAYFPRVYPGQTAYFGLFSTVSPGVSPASMEVEVSNDIGTSVRDASGEAPELTVSEPSEISTGYGLSRITGEMSLEGTDDSFAGSQVMLVAIFRDEEGEIVYLDYGVATCPDAGESIAVETTGGEYPDYESLEVYALPAVI